MAANNSLPGGKSSEKMVNYRLILVQVLVPVFLCINILQITTFFMKECFYSTMRYILFAVTLLSDCLFLVVTDIILILSAMPLRIQMWLCVILHIVMAVNRLVTPVTLTAMTLERYVAICMPLHHRELCSIRRAQHCILIIHCLSSLPCTVDLSILSATGYHNFYTQSTVCSVEVLILHKWQDHLRSAISQFYFLIMFIAIVFSYVKIMSVAKSASGENKKSTRKGLKTVILHGFQLLLCLIQLWCPFIDTVFYQIDFKLFVNVRYFNYVTFYVAPRCLSPLIYGLRDEKFFHALKYYALCGFARNSSFA